MSWFIRRNWVLILAVVFAVGIIVLGMNMNSVVSLIVGKIFSIL